MTFDKGKATGTLGRERYAHRSVSAGVVAHWYAWKMREVGTREALSAVWYALTGNP